MPGPTTPTTQALSETIVNQLEATIAQEIPLLPKSWTRVLAKVLAGAIVLLWKYAGFIFLQMFIAHATMDETVINGKTIRPLVEWGRQLGVGDPKDGTRAELIVEITVLQQTGTLATDSQLVRSETNVIYRTTAPVTLDAATKQVTIQASSDPSGSGGIGTIGNLQAGDIVSFANPLPNVASNATVVSVSEVGADAETEDSYRSRVLRRSQRKPQGGAYADYQIWAESVAGVENAYPYTGDTPGYVDVYVEATEAIDADGIAPSSLLDDVAAAIELDEDGLATNRPATALVNTLSITRKEIGVTVATLTAADEAAVKTAINEGLDEYLRTREPFITGLSVLPRQDRITRGTLGGVVNEIASAKGATVAYVLLTIGGNEQESYGLANGEKAKLEGGEATYV